jgi:hypothetical protein
MEASEIQELETMLKLPGGQLQIELASYLQERKRENLETIENMAKQFDN